MALIDYKDFFDFDAYENSIKRATKANAEFGAANEESLKRIAASYKVVNKEVTELLNKLSNFSVNTKGASDEVVRLGNESVKLAKKQADYKKIIEEVTTANNLSTKSIEKLSIAGRELTKEYKALESAEEKDIKRKGEIASKLRVVESALKMQTEALKVNTKLTQINEDSYKSWENELKAVTQQLTTMTGAYDKTTGKLNLQNKAVADLAARQQHLHTVLSTADQSMGRHTRNIGNYSSATFSLTQVLRELPSLANGLPIFFSAIGNNLPQLQSDFAKVAKEAGGTGKALGIFAKSLFSMNTVFLGGVTLLTVFGKDIAEFVKEALKGADAIDEIVDKQKLLNEVNKEANKNAAKQITDLKILYSVATDVNVPLKDRIAAVKTLKEEFPATFKMIDQEIILNGKAKKSYEELTQAIFAAARAAAAKDKMIDIEAQRLDLDFERRKVNIATTNEKNAARDRTFTVNTGGGASMGTGGQSRVQTKEEERSIIERRRLVALEKIEVQDKRLKNQSDFLVAFAEGEKQLAKVISGENDKKATDKKGKTADEILEERIKQQQEIAKAELDVNIAANEFLLANKRVSEEEFQMLKLDLIKKYSETAINLENQKKSKADKKQIAEFKKDRIEAETAYQNFITKFTEENNKADLDAAKKRIEEEASIKVAALNRDKEKQILNKKLTDLERLQLETAYQNKIDDIVISSLQTRASLELDVIKQSELLKQIETLRGNQETRNILLSQQESDFVTQKIHQYALQRINKDFYDGKGKFLADDLALTAEKLQKELELYKDNAAKKEELLKQVNDLEISLTAQLSSSKQAFYEAAENALTELIVGSAEKRFEIKLEQLEREKERELSAAGNNTAARAKIEEDYGKKEAEIRTRQAKAERTAALFAIGIDLAKSLFKIQAQAAVLLSNPLTAPLAAAALAQIPPTIGAAAINAGLILAQPLPKYFKGREGGSAEFAWVHENGGEMILDKNDRIKEVGNNSGAKITWLDHGDKVLTHDETKRIISGASQSLRAQKIQEQLSATTRINNDLSKASFYQGVAIAKAAGLGSGLSKKDLKEAVIEAFKHQPIYQTLWDERGMRLREKTINQTTTYLNKLSKI